MQDFFHSDRLELRLLGELEAEEFFAVVQSDRARLSQWLPWVDAQISAEHSEAFLAAAEMQAEMENGGIWGVYCEERLIGCITLHWIQKENSSASLGYWLTSAAQGKGYATEACQVLLEYCFAELELNRVELSAACANTPSLQLAKRLGFQPEGVRRQYERLHGQYWDHQAFGLLAADWTRQ